MAKKESVRNSGWGRRLRNARADYEKEFDIRLKWEQIAQMVSAEAGTRILYQAIQEYFKGREPQRFATVQAIARAFREKAGFLAFGEGKSRVQEREDASPPVDIPERQEEHAPSGPGVPPSGSEADYVTDAKPPKRGRRSG